MFGSIVIRQPAPSDPNSHLYDHDLPQHVIMVTDWFNDTATFKFLDFLYNISGALKRELQPDIVILNGKGHRLGEEYLSYSPNGIFEVEKDQRFRFRVIDTGIAACEFYFSIDGHVLTLIATDGNPVQPYNVTSIVLDSADRYDFIVHANRKVDNYWIRIEVSLLRSFTYYDVASRISKLESLNPWSYRMPVGTDGHVFSKDPWFQGPAILQC